MVPGNNINYFKVKEVKNELNDKIYFTSFPRYKETEEAC